MAIKFKVANKSPVPVELEGTLYQLPRFARKDWREWRERVDAERLEQALAGLTTEQAARIQLIYNQQPTTHGEMQRLIYSDEGAGHVFRTCAARAGVPEDVLVRVIDEGDDTDEFALESVALMLASVVDPDVIAAETEKAMRAKKSGKNEAEGDERFDQSDDPNDPNFADGGEDDPSEVFTNKPGGSETSSAPIGNTSPK